MLIFLRSGVTNFSNRIEIVSFSSYIIIKEMSEEGEVKIIDGHPVSSFTVEINEPPFISFCLKVRQK